MEFPPILLRRLFRQRLHGAPCLSGAGHGPGVLVSDVIEVSKEFPDDFETSDRYLAIPHKNDLDLGRALVLHFVEEHLLTQLGRVTEIFCRQGAYGRFKDLLAAEGRLEQWFDFEAKATEQPLTLALSPSRCQSPLLQRIATPLKIVSSPPKQQNPSRNEFRRLSNEQRRDRVRTRRHCNARPLSREDRPQGSLRLAPDWWQYSIVAVQLTHPDSPELWRVARRLVEDYAASLDVDLCFQNLEHELETLAGEYGPPSGRFVLAAWDGEFVGCGGLRRFTESTCEMKRLYVASSHRGKGIGQAIIRSLIDQARGLGYVTMLLDTLPSMVVAQHLYIANGFTPIPPYRHNPVPGASYFQLEL